MSAKLLYEIFQINTSDNINEFLLPVSFVMGSILYMFMANYMGQDVIDHANLIFITA